MWKRLMAWLGFSLVHEVRALDTRLSTLERHAGIDRAIADLTEGKGE